MGGLERGDRNASRLTVLTRLVRAYLGLGSNLGDREATLRGAVELLGTAAGETRSKPATRRLVR